MIKMSLLVALVLSCVAVLVQSAPVPDEPWKELHYKVYTTTGDGLSAEDALKIFKQLDEVYERPEYANDELAKGRKLRVEAILGACDVKHDHKCDHEYFDDVAQLISFNSIYKPTILPLLTHCRVEQFKHCSPEYKARLDAAYAEVSQHDKDVLDQFYDQVKLAKETLKLPGELHVIAPRPAIEQAIIVLMEKQFGPLNAEKYSKGKQGRKLFGEDLAKCIGDTCKFVRRPMAKPTDEYNMFVLDKHTVNTIDADTLVLIAKSRICREFNFNMDEIIEDVYKTVNPNGGKGKMSTMMGKLG